MQHSRFVSLNDEWRGRSTFLDLMAMLMQPRMLVAFFGMRVCFWLIVTLSIRALKSFSAKLPSSWLAQPVLLVIPPQVLNLGFPFAGQR